MRADCEARPNKVLLIEGERRVLPFVRDPGRRPLRTNTLLIRRYGLTPAEARLVRELMHGRSLEAATARLGIDIQVGRSQLKRILDKTATGRQAELIQLLVGGPALLR